MKEKGNALKLKYRASEGVTEVFKGDLSIDN
jgi:hypothetical protein